MAGKGYTIDMCHGPLLRQIIMFALPLMGSTFLQMFFNAADYMVIGRFGSSESLGAVGATGSLTNLLVNLFVGISMGANVVAAQAYGAKDEELVSKSVHTSAVLSLAVGILLAIVGFFVARPLLSLMKTPPNILDKSILYMQIYFAGMPFIMAYNFGSSILRAAGDTKRPLYYLLWAGFLNVLLNLFFVICCKRDVDGVALATIISQAMSAILVWRAVGNTPELGGLGWSKMRITWKVLGSILLVGVPTGLQSCSFAFSNTIIQSSINSFGAACVAGNTAAVSLEGFTNCSSQGFHYSSLSFAGQLYGGRKFNRLRQCIRYSICLSVGCTIVGSALVICFGRFLLGLYSEDPEVIDWGMQRVWMVSGTYFIHAIMQIFSGTIRGLGHSLVAFFIVLVFACIYRICWIFWVFPMHRTLSMLLVSFPISWTVVSIFCAIYVFYLLKRLEKKSVPLAE